MNYSDWFINEPVMVKLKDGNVVFGVIEDESEEFLVLNSPLRVNTNGKEYKSKRIVLVKRKISSVKRASLDDFYDIAGNRWSYDWAFAVIGIQLIFFMVIVVVFLVF